MRPVERKLRICKDYVEQNSKKLDNRSTDRALKIGTRERVIEKNPLEEVSFVLKMGSKIKYLVNKAVHIIRAPRRALVAANRVNCGLERKRVRAVAKATLDRELKKLLPQLIVEWGKLVIMHREVVLRAAWNRGLSRTASNRVLKSGMLYIQGDVGAGLVEPHPAQHAVAEDIDTRGVSTPLCAGGLADALAAAL